MDLERKKQAFRFSKLKGLSGKDKKIIIERFGSAACFFEASESDLKALELTEKSIKAIASFKKEKDYEEEFKKLLDSDIGFVSIEDDEYPLKLRSVNDPVYSLYYIGKLPGKNARSIGVVGSRKCTPYGKYLAIKTGEVLGANGIEIISGLAMGIDRYSHEGALNAGGKTFAVLGCGVNVVYPHMNWKVYERIIETGGGIISEYPPDTKPLAGYFPLRNRIISGLSDAVIVVEAAKKSGSLITADFALEQGRDVFAYPGRIGDVMSEGSNNLIKQGAGIILSPSDLLDEIDITIEKKKLFLEKGDKLVYSLLGLHPKSIDTICNESALSLPAVIEILLSLEARGLVSEPYRNHYIALYD